ncbi:hypothetical protein CKO51_16535 [Rhodopirellula sp. SM50]|nr:hypothetical protein CKO51_16535 [Rhodopirellula sp. SM50]
MSFENGGTPQKRKGDAWPFRQDGLVKKWVGQKMLGLTGRVAGGRHFLTNKSFDLLSFPRRHCAGDG